MEATVAAPAPIQTDFRAQLHQVIDQIQDEAALLLPQAAPIADAPEPELSPAWQKELDRRLAEYDPSKNIPFKAAMERLMQATV